MSYTNGNIVAPVTMTDISTAVEYTSGDLGTLITNGNSVINKWATYKPVRYNKTSALTYSERQSVNFGIAAPSTRSSAVDTLNDVWAYNRPRGGSVNEQYRMLDFNGYYKNAIPPCRYAGDISVDLSQVNSFSFGAYIQHPQGGGNNITWSDLPASVGSYYLCVVFSTGANCTGTLIAKTSTQTLSDSGIVLDLNENELNTLLDNGYKYYYMCARSTTITSLAVPTTNSADYLALPTAVNPATDVNGAFTIIPAGGLTNMVISTVSNSATPAGTSAFVDASDYLGLDGLDYSSSDYFMVKDGLNSLYYIHFGFVITAGSSSYMLNACKLKLNPTFYSVSGFSTAQDVTLYDSSFIQRNSITIPANSSAVVYMVAEKPLLSLDSSGSQKERASDQYFSTRVTLVQNNQDVADFDIRVRNYNF